jgi:hypothetical protein
VPPESQIESTLRRAFEANMTYYQALGSALTDYVRSLAGLWGDLRLPFDPGTWRFAPDVTPSQAATASAPPAPPAAARATPVLVLEADAGQEARGAFVVSNSLPRRVSAPVISSPFSDPSGREVRPALRLEPDLVTLDPGGKVVVEIVVLMSEELEPGVSYRGAIGVPGLSEGQVPVVLRRREARPRAAGTPPSESHAATTTPPTTPTAPATAGSRRAPAARPAARGKRRADGATSTRAKPRRAKT